MLIAHYIMITSLTNPHVKQAVKLRDGKKRREDGLFLIDGRREIQRAIESGIEIARIFYYPDGCSKEFTEKMYSSSPWRTSKCSASSFFTVS